MEIVYNFTTPLIDDFRSPRRGVLESFEEDEVSMSDRDERRAPYEDYKSQEVRELNSK